jgi:hypothetical protein
VNFKLSDSFSSVLVALCEFWALRLIFAGLRLMHLIFTCCIPTHFCGPGVVAIIFMFCAP